MGNNIEARVKFVYLSYDDISKNIEDGILDEYDVCITKDRHNFYIISDTLEPIELRSRVYVFDSESDAIKQLNQNTDTYNGQVIAVLCGDTYRGYIVNSKDNNFTITPLWKHPEPIDYNTLGNRPIINLEGTFGNPIIVSDLNDGIYNIKGQYKISNLIKTIYLSASPVLFIIRKDGNDIYIKNITTDKITDFCISNDSVSSKEYITDQYLKDNDYSTTDYVDRKIRALQQSIDEDVKQYISGIVDEQLGTVLDEKIETKLKDIMQPMDDSQVMNLFSK